MNTSFKIVDLDVKDIRIPTSTQAHGSDAMHGDPDYSCAYVTIHLNNSDIRGYGLSFTLGRGTELVTLAVNSLSHLVVGKNVDDIFNNFAKFWRTITSESQLRWVGPEKGVIHLATAAIVNALWDLWARLESKPLWKLLVDLSPEKLVSTIDFRYITDVITKEEAIEILYKMALGKNAREMEMRTIGFPAYTTQPGWLGYSEPQMIDLTKDALKQGFKAFKIKVGQNLEDDIKRCRLIRETIGSDNTLLTDANQVWDVNEAVEWMKNLAEFKPLWIEEPTSPDDILGHAKIVERLQVYGIKVATGEMCCNRVMFKQFMQSNALSFCQIDSCWLGGVNEVLAVYLMAKKLNVPVCPHAGGIGLCQMVQHLQIFDYVCVSGSKDHRFIEYVDKEHEHFEIPLDLKDACYIAPLAPGYGTKLKDFAIEKYKYPDGRIWKIINKSLYKKK